MWAGSGLSGLNFGYPLETNADVLKPVDTGRKRIRVRDLGIQGFLINLGMNQRGLGIYLGEFIPTLNESTSRDIFLEHNKSKMFLKIQLFIHH